MKKNLTASLFGATAAASLLAAAATPTTALAAEGEFGGQCAMGLSLGMAFPTTCKVTWASEDGKTYCFSSEASKTNFLKDPKQNLAKAQEFYKTTGKQ